jgi:hypothetical protein
VLSSSIERAQAFDGDVVGEMARGVANIPLPRFTALSPSGDTTGAIEAMPHYAGLSVGGVTRVQPAAEIVRELCEGAEKVLRARG